ncbi:MAG: peroxiredoxin [Pseudohongiellaceae bacterium]
MQLTDVAEQFEALGFSIAAISYDSVELLKEVQEDQEIEFPLLHDENVKHVNALGIRNLDYEPGHRVYGIPYPGIFLVDSNGVIKHKFAEERYQDRPGFEGVLEAATSM